MSTQPDRSAAPAVADPQPWVHPASQVHTLDGAAGVRTFDMPGQPVVCLEVTVPMPWAAEPRHLEGVSVIVATTMEEGTAAHDADSLARAFERAGVDLSIASTEQGLMVGLECTAEHLPAGLDLLTEVLARPTFPQAAVAREVRGRLFDIAQEMSSPSARAAREFATLLHGADHRKGRPGAGTAETVEALTAEDVVAHHRAWVRPALAQVVVAGDLAGDAAATARGVQELSLIHI